MAPCVPRVLHSDNRRGSGDPAIRDHDRSLVQCHPGHVSSLIAAGVTHLLGTACNVEVLRKIRVADHRLERQNELRRPRPPACFFFCFPQRSGIAVLAVVQ